MCSRFGVCGGWGLTSVFLGYPATLAGQQSSRELPISAPFPSTEVIGAPSPHPAFTRVLGSQLRSSRFPSTLCQRSHLLGPEMCFVTSSQAAAPTLCRRHAPQFTFCPMQARLDLGYTASDKTEFSHRALTTRRKTAQSCVYVRYGRQKSM